MEVKYSHDVPMKNMFDLVGVDFGTKRIGVALGVSDTKMAVPHEVWPNDKDFFTRFTTLLASEEIQKIIVGKPVALDQTETDMTKKVLEWVETLKQYTDIPVVLEDERMTSSLVENVQKGLPASKQKAIDSISAMLILQGYMDRTG